MRQNPRVTSSSWKYWALPSVADLFFVALLGTLVFTPLSVKLLGDAGIGWHIRTGQQILTSHSVPHVDPFSSQIGKTWFAWEWLYDVAVGKLEAWCGLNGVVWLTAVIIAGVFGAMLHLLVSRGTNLFIALVLVLLAVSASTIHFLARPHVVSWLFTLIWFWMLDSTERSSLGRIRGMRGVWRWVLPVSMLVWVNVHGGFVLGFVLLAAFWAGSLWTWSTLKESRIEESFEKVAAANRARELTLVGVASLGASFVNPYGWHLHAHIYSYLSDRFLMDHIDEFQSPNFHNLAPRCFLILLLVSLAVLIARGRELRLSASLLILFAVYSALYSSRNIPTSSILLTLIVGPLVSRFRSSNFAQRMSKTDLQMRGHLWPITMTIVTLAIAVNGGRVGASQWMDAHFAPQRMPADAVTFLRQQRVRGPIFSPDYWGGYLIYRLYPYSKVVVDDRHDFYGADFMQAYLSEIHLERGWDELLRGNDCLLLPSRSALAVNVARMPEWKTLYADDVATVFVSAREREDTDRVPRR